MKPRNSIKFDFGDGTPFDFDAVTKGGYEELIGLRLTKMEKGYVEAEIEVTPSLMNAKATLHGGVPAAMADTLAIYGCAYTYKASSLSTVGLTVSYLGPVKAGIVTDRAGILSKGKHVSLWKVELFDAAANRVAEATVTCAVGSK
jgi:1,4-dihydroxy-2-naphthoyl-CoA hydrolase